MALSLDPEYVGPMCGGQETSPITADVLQPRLRNHVIGQKVYAFTRLKSTNDFAKRLAGSGEEEGALIIADHQTQGRGRLARRWYAPPGKGLSLTVLLRPEQKKLQSIGLLALLSGLSVAQTVEEHTSLKPGLKWPNDVLIGRKKICGILVESEIVNETLSYIVVGIGVNVNQERSDFDERIRDKATSLRIEKQAPVDRLTFLVELLEILERNYVRYLNDQHGLIIAEWTQRCPFVQKYVKLTVNGREVDGVFDGIDPTGRLILRREGNGVTVISSGEFHTNSGGMKCS